MADNSKITDIYKAEITEILSRVSKGLSDEALSVIDPKIQDISSSVKSQNELMQSFKDENKTSSDRLNEIVESLESSVGNIKNATENIGNSIERRNENIISAIEKNSQLISQYDNAISDKLLSEIQKISNNEKNTTIETKLLQLNTKQKNIQKLMYVILVLLVVAISLVGLLVLNKNT
ncbi:hypothetical protein [Mesoflavibacter zeaxanthinifaciens]|uniref:hypothetical protein n=1 Tax=Mesoflavibacter zeaxanthinifaciens TaxID=393060 RepID=UPI003A8F774D